MKAAIEIDEVLMDELNREATRAGITVSRLVEFALRNWLSSKKSSIQLSPLPTFHGGGALIDIANRGVLDEAMEGQ